MKTVWNALVLATVGSFAVAGASGAVTLDASAWINGDDPIKENQSGTSTTGSDYVHIHGNGDLAVLTDYTLATPFDFSGHAYAPADDDIFGVLFGYVDGFNNYRISWTGGEDHDWEAGRRYGGLMLVEESNGEATTLWRDPDLMWLAGVEYNFWLHVDYEEVSFELREGNEVLADFSVFGDFTDVDGRAGVFTRSNAVSFYNLSDQPLAPLHVTPLPGGLPLLLGGAGLLLIRKRRRTV
ncbi:MAG: hypothetical protein AAGF50_00375 [Pseudomonadota bacterium]